MERLTTGLRVNHTADDPSQLGFDTQIRGLNQASKNASNGISFIQVSEGYLQETQDIIHRLRELAVQASNGVYSSEDRMYIQVEVSQLVDEIDKIASHAQFNGMNLLTGRFAKDVEGNNITASMWFHIGADMDQRERVFVGTMTTAGLKIRNPNDGSFINLENYASENMLAAHSRIHDANYNLISCIILSNTFASVELGMRELFLSKYCISPIVP